MRPLDRHLALATALALAAACSCDRAPPNACEVDADGDGYGPGCPLGPDCDDAAQGTNPSVAESCDGADNDCDGETDEGIAPLTCGEGACTRTVAACSGGVGQACSPGTPAGFDTCNNGKDDDCDGQIDEGCACTAGAAQACTTGDPKLRNVGVCVDGSQSCAGGVWGPCRDEGTPGAEVCGDGKDNDCDGRVDNGCACVDGTSRACYSGSAATRGVGPCTQGSQTCAQSLWGACQAEVTPVAEVCGNGVDDDCNNAVDDGCVGCTEGQTLACYSGPAATRTVGECKDGAQTCQGGRFGGCAGEVTPGAEACDNKDNDCDGKVDGYDQGCYGFAANTRGIGECKDGKATCTAGALGACTGERGPSLEVCDGKDNDCDGTVDGAATSCYGGPAGTAGVGECRAGTSACTAGIAGPCLGEVRPAAETCDNKDNDCDGKIDGNTQNCYSGRAGSAGVGVCRSGTQTCSAGSFGPCTGEVVPSAESCNALDDDCNAQADDGLGPISCGVGACQRTVSACTAGRPTPCVPTSPSAEVCANNLDEDCDGVADNGCACVYVRAGAVAGTGSQAAPMGTIAQGIALASTTGPRFVCVASVANCATTPGTQGYNEAVTMANGVSVYGGYDPGTWTRRAGCTTAINAQDARGVVFGTLVVLPSVLDGFTIAARNDPTNAAVTVEGSLGAVINNNTINGGGGNVSYGINVVDSAGAKAAPQITRNAIVGGTGTQQAIGVRSLRSSPRIVLNCERTGAASFDPQGRCLVNGCPGNFNPATRFIRGRAAGNAGGANAQTTAVRLEESAGAVVDQSALCSSASPGDVAAVRLSGDGTGTMVRASNLFAGGGANANVNAVAFWADACGAASPWLVNNAEVAGNSNTAGGRADGVRAVGDCHPRVDSNVVIVGGEESSQNQANGVFCARDAATGRSSRCTVLGNVEIRGSFAGFPPSSAGIRCDDGACARIERNQRITGRQGVNTFGVILGATDTYVARNVIDAGCAQNTAIGILSADSFARVENNFIIGATQCAGPVQVTPQVTYGVRAVLGAGRNELDLHSNDVAAGLVLSQCTSRAVAFDVTQGATPPGPRGIVRNNILHPGVCILGRYDVDEMTALADPRVFENNDLWWTGFSPTALYRDEAATNHTAVAAVNGMTDISSANNISADPLWAASNNPHLSTNSPCRNAGTSSGAPTEDIDGDSRPQEGRHDIGFDEYVP